MSKRVILNERSEVKNPENMRLGCVAVTLWIPRFAPNDSSLVVYIYMARMNPFNEGASVLPGFAGRACCRGYLQFPE